MLGLSFDFELFDDELPEFDALSLDDEFYPAFWMILSWVVEIWLYFGVTMNSL